MPSSIHVSLNVSDLTRSVDFYRRLFGEPVKWRSDYAKFVSSEPEIHLAIQPGAVAGAGPLSHLGIRVESPGEVVRWRNDLNARGLAPEEERREACCYALQEKFWVQDPDGTRWEIYTVLEDIERKADAALSCCEPAADSAAASCCAQ